MLEESTGNFSASRTAYDWFQDTSHVNLNIMVKNLTEDDVKVRLIDDVLDVTCSLADGKDFNLHFNLFRPIQVNESSWTVTPSKLEIKLKKTDRKRWQSLEVIPEKNSKRPASSAFPVLIQSPSKRITIQDPEALTTIELIPPEEEEGYEEEPMPSDGRVKYDWYQNETHVMVGVLIKNLVADETTVVFEPTCAQANLKLPDGSDYTLQLFLAHQINPSLSSFKVSQVKLELKMAKAHHGTWTDLEAAPGTEADVSVPEVVAAIQPVKSEIGSEEVVDDVNAAATNGKDSVTKAAKGPKNWDKIAKEIEEQEKDEGNVDDFFKKLYEGADEDARRAMVKSMQESGGTVLSTNWSEVGKDKVPVKPPDGCEFKKWD